ncbi:MAG: prepilin-type N-terminal cleavage/methylation domain-containing protein [Sumerlaeia bacterium]
MRGSNPAFTLLELLAVLLIVAVLAAIVVPNFTGSRLSPVSRVKSDMRSLSTALEAYAADHGVLPPGDAARDYVEGQALYDYGLVSETVTPARLTTPVAYLTHLFPDATFAGRKTKLPILYRLFPKTHDEPTTHPGHYLLQAAGPDGDFDFRATEHFYLFYPDRDVIDILSPFVYNPTNGTKSSGDLFRTSGKFFP